MSRTARQLSGLAAIIIISLSLFVTCDEFSLQDQFYPVSGVPLSVSPEDVVLFTDETQAFTASGGVSPYTYELDTADDIGTIGKTDGLFTPSGNPGTGTVTLTDRLGTEAVATIVVIVEEPLTISPESRVLAPNETQQFTASGGRPPHVFSFTSASNIGTITEDGFFEATSNTGDGVVVLEDADGTQVNATVYVWVPDALTIAPTSANVKTGESRQFTASGGVGPYVFSFSSGDGIGGVDSVTGRFEADDDNTGTGVLTVTDDAGTERTATVYVYDDAELMLAPSDNPLEQGQTIDLYPSGGIPPYSLGTPTLSEEDYTDPADANGSLVGSGIDWEYTASESIGLITIELITIELTDAGSTPYQLELTVLPRAPINFDASGNSGSNQSIVLSWDYATPAGAAGFGFTIERSVGGGPFSKLADVDGPARTYEDTGLQPTTLYGYRIYARTTRYGSEMSNESFALPK